MHINVLKEVPDDPALCSAWNELVLGMENREVFFTYQWALATSLGFREISPLLFLAYDRERLAGIAALGVTTNKPDAAFFLTSNTADYCDIVSAPRDRGQVLRALLDGIRDLKLHDLVLANIPADSATLRELSIIAPACRFRITSRIAYECGMVQFGDEQQRKELVKTVASKSREKRALKKLATLGSVRIVHLTEPQEVQTSMEPIISAQISRFLATGRVSPLVDAERRAFLSSLTDLLAHSGWLKISQLEVSGEPIAWNYGFRFGGSWFWYLPTFQMEYAELSPGSCLLRLLVEEGCTDSSLKWLDLGLGDESYKERFSNHVRQTRYVQLSRSFPQHAANVGHQFATTMAARFAYFGGGAREMRNLYRTLTRRLQETGFSATVQHSWRRAIRAVTARDEVLLFESGDGEPPQSSFNRLLPLTWDHLVQASIQNAHDQQTLSYLVRCAARMAQAQGSGFVLQDEECQLTHFLWTDGYDNFHLSEINYSLEPSFQSDVMIFDCWTPSVYRGRGHYSSAIRALSANLRHEGKKAWIFSSASNLSSLRGIEKAGFEYRFSLARQIRFGHSTAIRKETKAVVSAT